MRMAHSAQMESPTPTRCCRSRSSVSSGGGGGGSGGGIINRAAGTSAFARTHPEIAREGMLDVHGARAGGAWAWMAWGWFGSCAWRRLNDILYPAGEGLGATPITNNVSVVLPPPPPSVLQIAHERHGNEPPRQVARPQHGSGHLGSRRQCWCHCGCHCCRGPKHTACLSWAGPSELLRKEAGGAMC